ncbi:MAG TPA: ABC transporter permease subunit [Gaiellaceae bacterium]|jgi:ABC-2 type transport system permease protein|nr:ABC transporter permease subunit [Gaiellaceae bacterium]
MTDQLLSELRKMRSTRTNLGLLGGMIALILVFLLTIGLTGTGSDLADHDHQHRLFSIGTQAALFATLIGVMAITSEFRHGTIRSTFVVTPRRSRVIAAKVISSLLMGLMFGALAIGLSFGIGYAMLLARGAHFVLDTNDVLLLVLGTIAMTSLWAVLGVGFGAVIRNQVFAVIALIVWTGVVNPIIDSAVPGAGRYTPIAASASLTADPAEYLLSPLGGGLLLVAYAAVFVAAGNFLVARRDVT